MITPWGWGGHCITSSGWGCGGVIVIEPTCFLNLSSKIQLQILIASLILLSEWQKSQMTRDVVTMSSICKIVVANSTISAGGLEYSSAVVSVIELESLITLEIELTAPLCASCS